MKTVTAAGDSKTALPAAEVALLLAEPLTSERNSELIKIRTLKPGLLGWSDQKVKEAASKSVSTDSIIVAPPTSEAPSTGVLELFLDQFATNTRLRGAGAVPLTPGFAPDCHFAAELVIKPVLVELGAIYPPQGLRPIDSEFKNNPKPISRISQWQSAISTYSAEVAS